MNHLIFKIRSRILNRDILEIEGRQNRKQQTVHI